MEDAKAHLLQLVENTQRGARANNAQRGAELRKLQARKNTHKDAHAHTHTHNFALKGRLKRLKLLWSVHKLRKTWITISWTGIGS